MKKYLIDEDLRQDLIEVLTSIGHMNTVVFLKNLTPIKPLTNDEIKALATLKEMIDAEDATFATTPPAPSKPEEVYPFSNAWLA